MDALIQNLQQNIVMYAILVVAITPILYVFRKWTGPFLFHTFEGVVYASIVHLILSAMLYLFGGFKNATNMDAAGPQGAVNWKTPLFTPWERELYNPSWIFWVNAVAWIFIIYLVIFVRPAHRKNKYHGKEGKQGAPKKASSTQSQSGYQYRGGQRGKS